jgi:hypothetical protein
VDAGLPDARAADGARPGGDAGGGDAGPGADAAPGESCSADGWCWQNPLPQGNTLWSVHGTARDDVWAVGESGAVVHGDGTRWLAYSTRVHRFLDGVWANGRQDAVAVGEMGTILRWDGTLWAPVECGATEWLGAAWGEVGTSRFVVVGGNQAWALDGDTCTPLWTGGTYQSLAGVWGVGGEVWAVGTEWVEADHREYGLVIRGRGSAWTEERLDLAQRLTGVWAPAADDAWVVGPGVDPLHWDGTSWTPASAPVATYTGVWGAGSADVWATGTGGTLVRWDGETWTPVEGPFAHDLNGVWAADATHLWVVGGGGLVFSSRDAVTFTVETFSVTPEPRDLCSVFSRDVDDAWAVGALGTALRWDGSAWAPTPTGTDANLRGVWAATPESAWAVGEAGTVLAWDGAGWSALTTPATATLNGVWGFSTTDVWAAGDNGTVLHLANGTWELVPSAGVENLTAVWGLAPDDVWVVGTNDTALHWLGSYFETTRIEPFSGPVNMFRGLHGFSSQDVWAVGTEGPLHWDGRAWNRVDMGNPSLFAIWGRSPHDLWAVGTTGEAYHREGTTWRRASLGTVSNLAAITGNSRGVAWVVGDQSTVLWQRPKP